MEPDYKMILINLAHSLTLAEGHGDMMEDVEQALKLANIHVPQSIGDSDDEFRKHLENQYGATGIWG